MDLLSNPFLLLHRQGLPLPPQPQSASLENVFPLLTCDYVQFWTLATFLSTVQRYKPDLMSYGKPRKENRSVEIGGHRFLSHPLNFLDSAAPGAEAQKLSDWGLDLFVTCVEEANL